MTGSGGRQGKVAQAAFLLAVAAYMASLLVAAPGLPAGARLFPLLILAFAALFVVLKAISVASPAVRRYLEPDVGPGHAPRAGTPDDDAGKPSDSTGSPEIPGRHRAVVAWLWVVGAVASMYLLGFLVGTAVSVFVYLRFVAGETMRNASIVAGATLLFAYLVFARAMHIDFDLGVAGSLLGLG